MTGGHPPALPPVNHTAPVPRRIRAVLDGQVGEIARPAALLIYGDDATVEGLGAFSLGGELRSLPGVADHDATIPAYEFDNPLRG